MSSNKMISKMLKVILIVLIINVNEKSVLSARPKIECGYKQCPQTKDGALNVHLVPHSHMDAGWVKTFDEYYYGTRTSISTANVHLIYHSVLSELLHDKRRKFTFSETAYFWRWWKEQRPATRSTFRQLVQEGRIEFAGGGWVQNDEATPDYLQIIDHFTWGLRKLNDTLGPCGKPKASWQIDTYGHSREQTSLLAQMGYDGLFIGRVDHRERDAMVEEDRMEFMWRGSDVLGKMSDIMTHTLFNLYNAPEGFCFDFLCSDEPIVDDPDTQVYNVEKRVNDFIQQLERQAKYYDHDNIMVTMGGDFTYQSAANWYMNMDKLINHVMTHPGNISDVNIFYSTPSCYLKAIYLYGRRDKAIYTEKGDHMPYSSDANTYWTGFYSSRPSLKYFIRRAHVFLQVVKQLTVIARMGDSYELHLLRHAVNLLLHHDAITGTSQQHVTNDFIKVMSDAVEACTKKVSNLLSFLTPSWGGSRRSKNTHQFVVCHQLNISQCRFTETQDTMLLLVYNPLSFKTYHHVRLPAIALHYSIRDYNDEEVEYQLVPLPAAVINVPGRTSTVIQELCFEAENIPPLGYAAYYISPVRDQLEENEFAKKHAEKFKSNEPDQDTNPSIANEYLKVSVNKETGFLESVQHADGVRIELSQNFYYYSQGQQAQQSGAYCFRPESNRPTPVASKVTYNVVRGTIVKEIRQRFTDWITQIIRLYRGEEFIELEWIVGPVPIGKDLGKEVVTIFKSNVSNNGQFYTDSNGRQMMKRTCWNETASHQQKKPVSACYAPVSSRICLQSVNVSAGLCVLTDRPQGGTSYNDGEIELMVHRRLLTDDGFGLEESLNEEAYGVGLVVKGKHRITFGNLREIEDLTFFERASLAARKWQFEPWLFMTSGDKINRRKWQNVRNKRYSALRIRSLPRHVHILTLEPWKGGSVLLRLENTLEKATRGHFRNEKAEGPEDFVNKPSHITVQLRQLFAHLKIKRIRETTLAANQWLDDARQMDWSTRYVYQGSDDEILPEDNLDYRDETTKATRDRPEDDKEYKDTNFSEEDQEYHHHTQPTKTRKEKSRTKVKRPDYTEAYRKKRSLNNSENIFENIINGSFTDRLIERYISNEVGNINDDIDYVTTPDIVDVAFNNSFDNKTIIDWNATDDIRLGLFGNIDSTEALLETTTVVTTLKWLNTTMSTTTESSSSSQSTLPSTTTLSSSENPSSTTTPQTTTSPSTTTSQSTTTSTAPTTLSMETSTTTTSSTTTSSTTTKPSTSTATTTTTLTPLSTPTTMTALPKYFRESRPVHVTKRPPKFSFNIYTKRWARPRVFNYQRSSEEMTSSEEDFSSNLRKRSTKGFRKIRKKDRKMEESPDVDVTKSIYEMYYKTSSNRAVYPSRNLKSTTSSDEISQKPDKRIRKKPKTRRYQSTSIPDSHTIKARPKLSLNFEASEEGKKVNLRKKKILKSEIPALLDGMEFTEKLYKKRGFEDSLEEEKEIPIGADNSMPHVASLAIVPRMGQEDYDEIPPINDEDDENNDDQDPGVGKGRKKRTPPVMEEPTEATTSVEMTDAPEEPEFIITLRPTQIRTFVIYFDNNRANI